MKKTYLFVAAAALLFAGCASDEYLPGEAPVQSDHGAILFSSKKAGMTRADYYGKDAADLLNSKFVVEGTKDQPTRSEVFDNYAVEYSLGTAGNTTTNTHDWEYVCKKLNSWGAHNNANFPGQTIKYWDYSKSQYDFLAYSLGDGNAKASAIKFDNLTSNAYTLTGDVANLGKSYISDLVTVQKANYGNVVTLKFRNFDAKIRLAMYETIPGYAVKDVVFYTDATLSNGSGTNKVSTLYGETGCITTSGTYKVYVPTPAPTTGTDQNKTHVVLDGTATKTVSDYVQMGTLEAQYVQGENPAAHADLAEKWYLGRHSNEATYAAGADERHYVQVLPDEAGNVLNLHVDYTLVSIDGSGEEIKVVGATAQVPATYTQWKPNYAYTYLFKISDKTNGYTSGTEGTDPTDPTNPSGLYPITFDAVVINSVDDNIQETITTIDQLSTTTYAKGVNPTDNNEYVAGSNIYISVQDKALASPYAVTLDASNSKLYKITNDALTPVDLLLSEDDVYNVLVNGSVSVSNVVLDHKVLRPATVTYTTSIAAADATDGNETTLNGAAMKYTGAEKGYYAFVYTKTAATKTTYKAATGTAPDASTTYYVKGNFKATTVADATAFAAGTFYTYNPTTRVYTKATAYDATAKYYEFTEGALYHAVADMDQAKFDSYMADSKLYVVDQPGNRGEYAIKVLNVE